MSDYFNKVISGTTRPVATTLAAQKLSGATGATLVATTGWDTGTKVHGIMYRTDAGTGLKVAGSQIDWKATVSGTSLTSFAVTAGTDDTYAIGTTVELAPTSAWGDDIATGILVDHSQTGTHVMSTNFDPANPTLETQKWVGVASAVNEISVSNAATGAGPEIQATGGDTNIDVEIVPKGTGKVLLDSFYSWQRGTGTWAYVSASTFTVPQVDADLMSVGTKIWLTQTTSKWFYVTGVSGTTITVTAGSDYTVANAAITAPYFSNAASPVGFPHSFSWTPTLTNLSGGAITFAKFSIIGRKQFFRFKYTLGGAGVAGSVDITFPVSAAHGATTENVPGTVKLTDTGTGNFEGAMVIIDTTKFRVQVTNTAGTYAVMANLTTLIPHTWANTDVIYCDGTIDI